MARPTLSFGNTSHIPSVNTVPSSAQHTLAAPLTYSLESPSPLQRGTRDCLGPSCWDLAAGILLGLNGPRKLPTKPGRTASADCPGQAGQGMGGRGGVGTHSGAHSSRTQGLHGTHFENQSRQGIFFRFAWQTTLPWVLEQRSLGTPSSVCSLHRWEQWLQEVLARPEASLGSRCLQL